DRVNFLDRHGVAGPVIEVPADLLAGPPPTLSSMVQALDDSGAVTDRQEDTVSYRWLSAAPSPKLDLEDLTPYERWQAQVRANLYGSSAAGTAVKQDQQAAQKQEVSDSDKVGLTQDSGTAMSDPEILVPESETPLSESESETVVSDSATVKSETETTQ